MNTPLHLFCCLSAVGAAVVVPLSLKKCKTGVVVWLGLYLVMYWTLSSYGQYQSVTTEKKVWIPAYCGGVEHAIHSQPKAVWTPAGAFFLPLMVIDRLAVHRSKTTETD